MPQPVNSDFVRVQFPRVWHACRPVIGSKEEKRQHTLEGRDAYREGMLPTILGGKWRSQREPEFLDVPAEIINPLFNWCICFWRDGTVMPTEWGAGTMMGFPLNVFGADGRLVRDVLPGLDFLAAKGSVCWIRPDLSFRRSGGGVLVLASPELHGLDPFDFGFWHLTRVSVR